MKRIIFILTVIIFSVLPCFSYTVEEAREVAFRSTETELPMFLFKEYLYDMFCYTHIRDAQRGKQTFCDYTADGEVTGTITLYYYMENIDHYTLVYDKHPSFVFEYNYRGYLHYITFRGFEDADYPIKRMKYNSKGKLTKVLVVLSQEEAFIFDKNKKLIIRWIGKKAYNSKGKRVRVFTTGF